MNCDRVRSLIDAYTTDELDLAATVDVEEHLHECPACAADLESLRALRRTVQDPSLRYTAPAELRRRVSDDLNRIDAMKTPAPHHRSRRFALAAAIAALLVLPWLAMYRNSSRFTSEQLAAEITSSHIRSLMADHLLDVPSTDQHTVKPWFNGKLDFSPTVVDLTAQGFPLIGGRLDYINNRPVAAIVYQRHKHLINLYTWPSPAADAQPSPLQHNGYNVLTWTHSRMNCVAVSDVNQQELRQFADLLRRSSTPSTTK
jgi:anti-sigma factor RsiW